MRILITMISVLVVQAARADDCSSVIALSKTSSSTVSSKNTIEQAASNFCNEYSRAKSSGQSMNIGASYYAISGNFGSSSSDVEQVASKYCSAASNYNRADDAYQQYVDNIAPGAFQAYQQCLSFSNSDIQFSVNQATILPTQLGLVVNYIARQGAVRQGGQQTADLSYIASEGIRCAWSAGSSVSIRVPSPTTVQLYCRRNAYNQKGFVTVVRTDGGSQIALPWPAYNGNGVPVDTVADLNRKIESLEQRLSSTSNELKATRTSLTAAEVRIGSEQAGIRYTIVPQSGSCPNNWTRLGVIGFIVHNPDYTTVALDQGGAYNTDWTWTHPQLCRRN